MIRAVLALLVLLVSGTVARAETGVLRLGVQPGLTYLPFAVIQHENLIEKTASAAGLNLKVSYLRFSGGPAMNDGLMSDNIDVAATGIPSFLTLWAKGRGRLTVRGLMSYGYIPIALVTRNPNVRTLADFTEKDRIALPGVRTSTQAIFLGIAAERLFGPGKASHFDAITVTRAHPDAMAALLGNTEINSHFAIPPYLDAELKRPDIHVVATSIEMVGTPVSNGTIYLTEAYSQANPKTVAALYAAVKDAMVLINTDPRRAAAAYLAISGEHTPIEDIQAMITAPGVVYDIAPHGIMAVGSYLFRNGMIAAAPAEWKEPYLPLVHGEPGG